MNSLLTTTGGRAVLLVALLGLVSCVWWLRARRSGSVRSARDSAPPPELLLLEALRGAGARLGERATFVQISSEVCTPCRRTATVLARLVDEAPGVAHVELDAAVHLDLVRTLRVLRTPTVLVLDEAGRERGRSSGAMTPVQARTALALVPGLSAPPHPGTSVRPSAPLQVPSPTVTTQSPAETRRP